MSYVGKIKDTAGNTHLVGSTLYGTCSTAAGTAAKVVTCANFDKLEEGVTIHVKFTYSNTAANATMNVNSTGAKNLCSYGTTRVGTSVKTSWQAGAVVSFTYDGTSWVMNDYIADTDTDTKNTAGSTQNSTKLFLVGTTSQTTSSQTYSDIDVYEKNGALFAQAFNDVKISANSVENIFTGFDIEVGASSANASLHVDADGISISASNGGPTVRVQPGANYTLADACAKAVDSSIASGSSSTNLPTSQAVADYVDSAVAVASSGALTYKGTAANLAAITGTSYKKGWYWIASAAFAIGSQNVEAGDMIIAKQDKTSTAANDLDLIQTNIEALTSSEIDALWAAA